MAEELLKWSFRFRHQSHTLTIYLHRNGMIDALESTDRGTSTVSLTELHKALLIVFDGGGFMGRDG